MKIKGKHILLSGLIPIILLIFWFIWGLILDGLSEKSDITVILSVLAIGFIIVVIGFTIKFLIKL
jgi:hypothetical protein